MKYAFEGLSDETHQRVTIDGRAVEIMAFSHPSAHGDKNWGQNYQTAYLVNTVTQNVTGFLDERDRKS